MKELTIRLTIQNHENLKTLKRITGKSVERVTEDILQALLNIDPYLEEDYAGWTINQHADQMPYLLAVLVEEAVGPYTKEKHELIKPLRLWGLSGECAYCGCDLEFDGVIKDEEGEKVERKCLNCNQTAHS